MTLNHNIIVYDPTCSLCRSAVRLVIQLDLTGLFKFTTPETVVAQKILHSSGIDKKKPETLVLKRGALYYTHSDAILYVLDEISFPWFLVKALWLIPKGLRDRVYKVIARIRHRINTGAGGSEGDKMTLESRYPDRFIKE